MSEINEKKVSFSPPVRRTREQTEALQDWTDDRMKLLGWRPFIGTLAMNLELIPVVDHRCPTASTDGKRIFFNPHFLNDLTNDERMTILAHEIWHCGCLTSCESMVESKTTKCGTTLSTTKSTC